MASIASLAAFFISRPSTFRLWPFPTLLVNILSNALKILKSNLSSLSCTPPRVTIALLISL